MSFADWEEGDEHPEAKYNHLKDGAGQALQFAHNADDDSGLQVAITGGNYSESVSSSDTNVTCTDDDDTYIVMHRTTGAITGAITTTNWNATTTYGRIGIATFASGVLTAFKDLRKASGGVFDHAATIGAVDADDVTYTPTTLADWDGSADPGDVEQALDQLAERVTDVESAVGGTAGKHAIYIAAGSITPSATGGCAALATIASAANQPDIQTLDFDSGATNEYAQFGIVMPKSWNEGTVTARFHWSHASGSGDVIWGLQALAVSNDDAIAQNFGTAQEVTDTGGTVNDLYTTSETSAITVAGSPAAEDMVFFRVYRNSNSGSDTLGVDARLHGITLYITTDAENDA